MCLETKKVVSSHLYPAALYVNCRSANDASPVRMGDGVVMQTDRQMQDYLLCEECEDILNRGGEKWTNPKLARLNKTFPLYEILVKGPTGHADETGGIYFASSNPEIDVEKMTHFALGIFWKASVYSWKANERNPMIQLGPYGDLIRLWLRGERAFPEGVCLSVLVARPEQALIVLNGPSATSLRGWHAFLLNVPGVSFILNVGRHMDPEMILTCFHESPQHPVFVSDEIMGLVWKRFVEQFLESRKTKSYLAAKAKRSPIGKPEVK